MLPTYFKFLKSIKENNTQEFEQLFSKVNTQSYNNVAFKLAIKYQNFDMAEKLFNINDEQTWFDNLLFFTRNNPSVFEFLHKMLKKGVKGVKPLSTLLEDAGYNKDMFELLLQHKVAVNPEEENVLLDLMSMIEYKVIQKTYYQLPKSIHTKIRQKVGLLDVEPHLIKDIKEGNLEKLNLQLDEGYVDILGLEKLDAIFGLIENKTKAISYLSTQLENNQYNKINIQVLNLLDKHFNLIPKKISVSLFHNLEAAQFILDKNEFNEENLLTLIKHLEYHTNEYSSTFIHDTLTPYLERFNGQMLDSILFNKTKLRFSDWNKYTQSLPAFEAIDDLEKIKKLAHINSDILFFNAEGQVKSYLANFTQLTDKVLNKTYDYKENDIFETLLLRGAKLKKICISNIEILKKYPHITLESATFEFNHQLLNMEQSKWLVPLYLKDKIKTAHPVIDFILLSEYKESCLKKILTKDIKNNHTFNLTATKLSDDLVWQLVTKSSKYINQPNIKGYELIKRYISINDTNTLATIEALKQGYFDLINQDKIKEILKNNLYLFSFKHIPQEKYAEYLETFGFRELEIFNSVTTCPEFLNMIEKFEEKKQLENTLTYNVKESKKLKV